MPKLPKRTQQEIDAFEVFVFEKWSTAGEMTFDEIEGFIQQMVQTWEKGDWSSTLTKNLKIEVPSEAWEEIWSRIHFEISEPLELDFNHKKNETAASMVNFIQLVAITIYVLAIGFALYVVGIRWWGEIFQDKSFISYLAFPFPLFI